VVLHGDFHPRQVIDDGEKAALIDFDESLVGPAAVDLGRFISELHMNVARGEISEVAAESAADALVEGYSGTRAAPSASSIRNFTALALLNLAHEPFRRHHREWPTEISAILDSVERLLEAGA
ncbi:MAG TPA: phosphotransferase, partial [Gemmatimonadaceae bacterium]|nr:phosphotransferase [Gemmatimonadaceae bacterium]